MNLWIRSQDRMNLVQIKQISLNYQNNKQVIANYEPEQYENSGCFYELLGTYSTKERALEVLDEIQGKITQNECLKTMIPKVTDIRGYEEMYGNLFKKMVYEMPLE